MAKGRIPVEGRHGCASEFSHSRSWGISTAPVLDVDREIVTRTRLQAWKTQRPTRLVFQTAGAGFITPFHVLRYFLRLRGGRL